VLAPQIDQNCALSDKVDAWYHLPEYDRHSLSGKLNMHFRYILSPRPTWAEVLRMVCQQHLPQVIWFSYGHWGQYAAIAREVGARTVMDAHNIQSHLTKQRYRTMRFGKGYVAQRMTHWAQRRHEHWLFRCLDRIVSVSETDRQYHARSVGGRRSLLIPNYINEEWYNLQKPVMREDNLLVMTGNFAEFQNRQGVIWFLSEVWPQVRRQVPTARFQLVGRGSETMIDQARLHLGVACVGEVPSVAFHLRQATVAVVPLLHGSGTRFKILEALACETPIVGTTLAAEGIEIVSGDSALLADSGRDFARATVMLLKNKQKRTQLVQGGLTVLRRSYGFQVNTERIRQIVEEVVAE
jgi:glycosyltransferase involved in cell wall biosynthesis